MYCCPVFSSDHSCKAQKRRVSLTMVRNETRKARRTGGKPTSIWVGSKRKEVVIEDFTVKMVLDRYN